MRSSAGARKEYRIADGRTMVEGIGVPTCDILESGEVRGLPQDNVERVVASLDIITALLSATTPALVSLAREDIAWLLVVRRAYYLLSLAEKMRDDTRLILANPKGDAVCVTFTADGKAV
jgi:hypothetical protein